MSEAVRFVNGLTGPVPPTASEAGDRRGNLVGERVRAAYRRDRPALDRGLPA